MSPKMRSVFEFFRGGRIAIPIVAVAIIAFFAFGGHRKVMGFALNQVAGFLLGVGGFADGEVTVSLDDPEQVSVDIKPDGAIVPRLGPATATASEEGTDSTAADPATQGWDEASGEDPAEKVLKRKSVRVYNASFLRDPFHSLVASEKDAPARLLEVGGARMVGSVWGESGMIALLEDENGRSYALKAGDRVVNGRVLSVSPSSVKFSITAFGLTRSVTLELAEEGEW
jgi:hypothetical protein